MFTRIARHLTYANVCATLALLIALTGGVAFAATKLAPKSVKTGHIANGAVGAPQLKKNAVGSPQIRNK